MVTWPAIVFDASNALKSTVKAKIQCRRNFILSTFPTHFTPSHMQVWSVPFRTVACWGETVLSA